MNLRFVEAFYWVASLRSVTRAADKLFLTQSAMSARIAALEDELGVLLLDRRDKHFRLTVAGMRFLGHAQQLLELQRQIKVELGAGQTHPVSLRLGVIESVLHSWLIPWIGQLRQEHPTLELELSVETTPVLIEQVSRGTLDLVLAALPATFDGVVNRSLPPMDMAFVGHAQHHRRRRYTLSDLAAMDLLTFQRGSQPHVALLDLFRQGGLAPPRIHAISSISAMVQLVQGGFGVATLPRHAVASLQGHTELRLLRCDGVLQPLPIHASHRLDPSSSLVDAVCRSALTYASTHLARAPNPSRGVRKVASPAAGASKKSMS